MAITIVSSPQSYIPCDNEVRYLVNSTNKTQCNFEYVADVYVNGGASASVRIKLSPNANPGTGYGEFYFQDFLKSFVSYDMGATLVGLTGFSRVPNSIASYRIAFGESYDSTSGCTGNAVVYPNLATGSTGWVFAGEVGYSEWPTYDDDLYMMSSSGIGFTAGYFLTKGPTMQWVHAGEQSYLDFLQQGTGSTAPYLVFEGNYYGPTGAYTRVISMTNTLATGFTAGATASSRRIRVGVGPENLLNTTGFGASAINDTLQYYRVWMSRGTTYSGATVSETKTYWYGTASTQYDYFQFVFQGSLGSFETKTFRLRSTQTTSIERRLYEKLMRNWQLGDRGRAVVDVNATDTFTVTSEPLTDQEALWLRELYVSPEVYVASVNPIAYSSGVFNQAGSLGIRFNQPHNLQLKIGDKIVVDKMNKGYASGYDGVATVTAVTANTIVVNKSYSLADTAPCWAKVYRFGYRPVLNPIVITDTTWSRVRNTDPERINQLTISFQMAYSSTLFSSNAGFLPPPYGGGGGIFPENSQL